MKSITPFSSALQNHRVFRNNHADKHVVFFTVNANAICFVNIALKTCLIMASMISTKRPTEIKQGSELIIGRCISTAKGSTSAVYKISKATVVRQHRNVHHCWIIAWNDCPNIEKKIKLLPKKQVSEVKLNGLKPSDTTKGLWCCVAQSPHPTTSKGSDKQKEETDETEVQPKKEHEQEEENKNETTEQPTKSTRKEKTFKTAAAFCPELSS